MIVYPATFEKDGNYIFVQFPDIPEAVTQGVDFSEALEMAKEVLDLVLEDRQDLPKASSLDAIKKLFPDKTVELICLDLD